VPLRRRTGPLAFAFRRVPVTRFGRPVLRRVTEDKATGKDAAFHSRIAGQLFNLLAESLDRVRTTPTSHSFSLNSLCSDEHLLDVTKVTAASTAHCRPTAKMSQSTLPARVTISASGGSTLGVRELTITDLSSSPLRPRDKKALATLKGPRFENSSTSWINLLSNCCADHLLGDRRFFCKDLRLQADSRFWWPKLPDLVRIKGPL
jgi:hypothetical protein